MLASSGGMRYYPLDTASSNGRRSVSRNAPVKARQRYVQQSKVAIKEYGNFTAVVTGCGIIGVGTAAAAIFHVACSASTGNAVRCTATGCRYAAGPGNTGYGQTSRLP